MYLEVRLDPPPLWIIPIFSLSLKHQQIYKLITSAKKRKDTNLQQEQERPTYWYHRSLLFWWSNGYLLCLHPPKFGCSSTQQSVPAALTSLSFLFTDLPDTHPEACMICFKSNQWRSKIEYLTTKFGLLQFVIIHKNKIKKPKEKLPEENLKRKETEWQRWAERIRGSRKPKMSCSLVTLNMSPT